MNENTDDPFESQSSKPVEPETFDGDDDSNTESSVSTEYYSGEENEEDESEDGSMGSEGRIASPKDDGGLSTYEKMRLERIRRNKEYLATLGLEKLEENREVKQRKTADKWEFLEKRETIHRRSKMKEVHYSSPKSSKRPRLSLEQENETQACSDRLTRRPKSSSRVSLVIYRELKAVQATRRREFKAAKKLLRVAEVELRYAKRQAAISTQKQQRILWEEQMKVAAQAFHNERKQLLPMIQELDSRRGELLLVRDKVRRQVKAAAESSQTRRIRTFQNMRNAQLRFSATVKESKLHLAHLLFDRVCSMESVKDEAIIGNSSKSKVSRGKEDSALSMKYSKDLAHDSGININDVLDKVKNEKKGTMSKNVRNVWGPVSGPFAETLQRQWLEYDAPVAANLIPQYVPQVGDAIL